MLETVLSQRPLTGCAPPGAVALLDAERELTYAQLARRIEARAAELDLPARSLVVLEGERSIELVVTYLALLWSGRVPLLAARGGAELAEHWGAAAHLTASANGLRVRRLPGRPPALHPDLALLLPTSGSTGCPKLVRLSRRNLLANAASIAGYLGLHDGDRAISSLPLHYCYGLSVLHAHLHVRGSMVLTESSVVDRASGRSTPAGA
ncbi:MAG: AMP-binding protein [Acidimicrobiales bacterium]